MRPCPDGQFARLAIGDYFDAGKLLAQRQPYRFKPSPLRWRHWVEHQLGSPLNEGRLLHVLNGFVDLGMLGRRGDDHQTHTALVERYRRIRSHFLDHLGKVRRHGQGQLVVPKLWCVRTGCGWLQGLQRAANHLLVGGHRHGDQRSCLGVDRQPCIRQDGLEQR